MTETDVAWIRVTAPQALAYAISLVQNRAAAEDLVQDCFQRLLAKSGHYDLPADGAKLLYRAVTRACINWTQRRPPEISLHDVPSAAGTCRDGPVAAAMRNELESALATALAELPIDQRSAVELASLGHSASDIAETLQTTAGNARVLLHRGRQQLAERLQPFLKEL